MLGPEYTTGTCPAPFPEIYEDAQQGEPPCKDNDRGIPEKDAPRETAGGRNTERGIQCFCLVVRGPGFGIPPQLVQYLSPLIPDLGIPGIERERSIHLFKSPGGIPGEREVIPVDIQDSGVTGVQLVG